MSKTNQEPFTTRQVILLSLSNDLKRITTSIQRGSTESAARFNQEAKRWLYESKGVKDTYLEKLLTKVEEVLKQKDDLKKAEDCLMYSVLLQNEALLLPGPWINITSSFDKIIEAFQNVCFIGELRERWSEIKKLQPNLASV